MKYCPHCGAQQEDAARFCSDCGSAFPAAQPAYNQQAYNQPTYNQPTYGQQPYARPSAPAEKPAGRTLYAVIGFFFPLVGFILWLLLKGDREGDARKAGKGALISVILGAILSIALIILTVVFTAKGIIDGGEAIFEVNGFEILFSVLFHFF